MSQIDDTRVTEGDFARFPWTACPVPNTLVVADQMGYLARELAPLGVRFYHLGMEQARGHYTGATCRLFRFGGDAPPMVARSFGAHTRVVGIIPYMDRRGIVVRKTSPLRSVAELKGRRVGVAKGLRENSHNLVSVPYRDFVLCLEAQGLGPQDVEYARIYTFSRQRRVPAGASEIYSLYDYYADALLAGEVEAIYLAGPKMAQWVAGGEVRVLFELSSPPQRDIGAIIITVDEETIRERPELVKEFVKLIIRTGQWCQQNPHEVIRILARDAGVSEKAVIEGCTSHFHENLVPGFSPEHITALKGTEKFLKDHLFIPQDFHLEDWLDRSFLERARAELEVV